MTPDKRVEDVDNYFPEDLRMNAYYYSFKKTGNRDVDKVLSAVAIAGKAFHSTDQWSDDGLYGDENLSATKLIQYAADKLAQSITKHHQDLMSEVVGLKELESILEDYCIGGMPVLDHKIMMGYIRASLTRKIS